MTNEHWTAELNELYRGREFGEPSWILRYDPTPGGKKNANGSTTYSLSFPALQLTEYPENQEEIAKSLARDLNSHADVVDALSEVLKALREEAPGTPLNNHRFDALGIKAYAALAKAGAQ